MKTPERHQWHRSGVFIVNFGHISLFLGVSIVDFEQVNVSWDRPLIQSLLERNPYKLVLYMFALDMVQYVKLASLEM